MPAARYWRIIGVEAYGGDLELSEIALYEGATRVDGSATLTSTFAPISGSLANLQDADTGTTTRFAGADVQLPGFALVWDFGVGVTKDVVSVGFASPVRERYPSGFVLQYSTDGEFWSVLYLADRTKFAGVNTVQQHRYVDWRFLAATVFLYRFETPETATVPAATLLESFYPLIDTDGITSGGTAATTVVGGNFGRGLGVLGGSDFGFLFSSNNSIYLLEKLDVYNAQVFTFEMFFKLTSTTNATYSLFLCRPRNVTNDALSLVLTRSATGLKLKLLQNSATPILETAEFPNTSTFRHYTVTREGGGFALFVDGVLSAQTTGVALPAAATSSNGMFVVAGTSTLGGLTINAPAGVMDSVRLVNDAVLYTANFTPPTTDLFLRPDHDSVPVRATPNGETIALSEYTPPTFTTQGPAPLLLDLTDGGTGTIYGTVKKDDTPTDLPLARRVRLYEGPRLVRETWSNDAGDFTFTGIATSGNYWAVVYDHLEQYRAVISDRLVAENG